MNVLRLKGITRSYSEKWQKEELLRAAWLLTIAQSGLWEGEKKCFQILILLRSTFLRKYK